MDNPPPPSPPRPRTEKSKVTIRSSSWNEIKKEKTKRGRLLPHGFLWYSGQPILQFAPYPRPTAVASMRNIVGTSSIGRAPPQNIFPGPVMPCPSMFTGIYQPQDHFLAEPNMSTTTYPLLLYPNQPHSSQLAPSSTTSNTYPPLCPTPFTIPSPEMTSSIAGNNVDTSNNETALSLYTVPPPQISVPSMGNSVDTSNSETALSLYTVPQPLISVPSMENSVGPSNSGKVPPLYTVPPPLMAVPSVENSVGTSNSGEAPPLYTVPPPLYTVPPPLITVPSVGKSFGTFKSSKSPPLYTFPPPVMTSSSVFTGRYQPQNRFPTKPNICDTSYPLPLYPHQPDTTTATYSSGMYQTQSSWLAFNTATSITYPFLHPPPPPYPPPVVNFTTSTATSGTATTSTATSGTVTTSTATSGTVITSTATSCTDIFSSANSTTGM